MLPPTPLLTAHTPQNDGGHNPAHNVTVATCAVTGLLLRRKTCVTNGSSTPCTSNARSQSRPGTHTCGTSWLPTATPSPTCTTCSGLVNAGNSTRNDSVTLEFAVAGVTRGSATVTVTVCDDPGATPVNTADWLLSAKDGGDVDVDDGGYSESTTAHVYVRKGDHTKEGASGTDGRLTTEVLVATAAGNDDSVSGRV